MAGAMRLRQFRCLWGMIHATDGHLARSPHADLSTFLPAVKALGYEGVEVPLKIALHTPDWKQRMDDNGLETAFVLFTELVVSLVKDAFDGIGEGSRGEVAPAAVRVHAAAC